MTTQTERASRVADRLEMGMPTVATLMRDLAAHLKQMHDALVVAREFISTDRTAFADAAMPPDGRPMEEDDAAELADYDAALLQINAAIEKAGVA